jgi:hypothetical protein
MIELLGVSITDVAKAADIRRSRLSLIVSGRVDPSMEEVHRIAGVLAIHHNELLAGRQQIEPIMSTIINWSRNGGLHAAMAGLKGRGARFRQSPNIDVASIRKSQ